MSEKMPLEQWFEEREATTLLVENLKANLEVMCPTMKKELKETLMRLNLTMIRRCLQDCGADW